MSIYVLPKYFSLNVTSKIERLYIALVERSLLDTDSVKPLIKVTDGSRLLEIKVGILCCQNLFTGRKSDHFC